MRRIIVGACLWFWAGPTLGADSQDLSARVLAVLGEDARLVVHWSEVASPVRAELNARFNTYPETWKGQNSIVDPGENFQATDAIAPNPPPLRRLVLAVRGRTGWLVYYERGGIALTLNLVVVPTEGSRVVSSEVRAIRLPPPPAKDLDSLRALVRRLADEKRLNGNQDSF